MLDFFLLFFIIFYYYFLFLGDFWADPKNGRNWFDDFACERSFDPLLADNWYNLAAKSIYSAKV
jgi:hypothetical protein